jgi:ATP-dependent helicase/nuclease subunit A
LDGAVTAPQEAAYRIDGGLASRERFYAVACDSRRSVVVEACAGAGKTWMLVSRILRALLDGCAPEEILAITFTRKAAGEMRERLGEWLAWLASAERSDEERIDWLCERGLTPDAARRIAADAATLHERVLSGGRAVRVHTFHGWFSQLLRAAPFELLASLGLQPGMDLVEDTADLENELFRRFHAAVLADPALHADYAALVRERGRTQVRQWLLAAWDKRIEIELADAAGTLETSVPALDDDGLAHPADALHQAAWREPLHALVGDLGRGGSKGRKAADHLLEALERADALQRFKGVWAALFTGKGERRKQLGDTPLLPPIHAALEALDERIRSHDTRAEHLRMVRLARVLLRQYATLKRQRGVADMADLERCALELLRDADLSAWVQERLDARLRHVLIDEFQDTSALQWQALHSWFAGYAGTGGGAQPPSVFIVGDPKQSIYRFRRAEPRVFAAARSFVSSALGGTVLECDHSRRNPPALLAAVNQVFEQAQGEGAFSDFRPHTSACAPTEAPTVWALPAVVRPARLAATSVEPGWRDTLTTPRHEPEEVLREQEAAHVADAITQLLAGQGMRPGEVMVLCRKRASLRLLAEALQRLHIPFAAAEEFALLDAPLVRDLIALFDVLASPQHNLSLAHALRSALFDASDDDLTALALRAASRGGAWWDALADAPAAELSVVMQRAKQLLARWQLAARRLPPHDLLDLVAHEGDLLARVMARVPPAQRWAARDALDALFAQALDLDGGRYATPYNFVRALRRRCLKAMPAQQHDAVQLLTVHGAKGLEARCVFVMDSDPQPQNSEMVTLLIDWPIDAAAPVCCAFVASEARCPPALVPLLEQECAARAREELNGLYVAMTRARERIVFSHTEPSRRGETASWWQRVQAVAQPFPALPSGAAAPIDAAAELRVLPRWSPAEANRAAPNVSVDSTEARLGRAVHRLLEWCSAAASRPDTHQQRRAAQEFGLEPTRAAEIGRLATAILDSTQCQPFYDRRVLHWAGNEVAFADAEGSLRIDRLVALETPAGRQWWVLDYKLSHAPQENAANREQLMRYRRAVGALQVGERVRAAFITSAGTLIELEEEPNWPIFPR